MEGIWKWVRKPSHHISPHHFAVYYNKSILCAFIIYDKRTKNGLNTTNGQ